MSRSPALLLVAHGTVENLDDLPAFVTNIRRGHAPPPELIAELRRRYAAIGGRSPLLDISRSLAKKLERRLGVPTRIAMRLWHPYAGAVATELAAAGVNALAVVPLAQHSAAIYGDVVKKAVSELALPMSVHCATNWGQSPALVEAYAGEIRKVLAALPREARDKTTLLLTAHSLPVAIIRAGDQYEKEFRASAEAVVKLLGEDAPRHVVAFQSQGIGTGMEWLGPDLQATLGEIAKSGQKKVIFAPIGFLADHVEILYDLDVEAREWARGLGLETERAASLNDSDALVEAIAAVAAPLLAPAESA
jgi:ferrochelatase